MLAPGGEAIFWVYLAAVVVTVIFAATMIGLMVVTQRRQLEQSRRFSKGLVEAQESERARIARELHDDIIQRVALIGGEVSGLARVLHDPTGAAGQRIEGIREELHDLAEEIRAMARRAHPSVLEHLGLVKAIQGLATEMGVSDNLHVEVVTEPNNGIDSLSPSAALSLYRVAQEGLRNVARHAGTQEATLELTEYENGVKLVVGDAGRGLDLQAAPSQGLGLLGLGERLRAVQGRLTVESSPGKGTRLIVWVPFGRPSGRRETV
jgi:signal transduction histidine kinase